MVPGVFFWAKRVSARNFSHPARFYRGMNELLNVPRLNAINVYTATSQARFTASTLLSLAILALAAQPSAAAEKSIKTDRSFGKSGYLRLDSGGRKYGPAPTCALDTRGKLLAYSQFYSRKGKKTPDRAAATRHGSRGQLDRTFGNNGKLYKFVPRLPDSIKLDSRGMMLASAVRKLSDSNSYQLTIGRIKPSGLRDISFGTQGVMSTLVGEADSKVTPLAAGRLAVSSNGRVTVFNSNGQPDETFGVGGTVNFEFNVSRVVELPDRRLIVGGATSSVNSAANEIVVTRVGANGTPDATFGLGGTYRESDVKSAVAKFRIGDALGDSQPTQYEHVVSDLALLSNGSIQVVIESNSAKSAGDGVITVRWSTRLNKIGLVASNYGAGGAAYLGENYFDDGLDIASSESVASTILRDGRIAIVSTSWTDDKSDEKDDFASESSRGLLLPNSGSRSSSKARRFTTRGFAEPRLVDSLNQRYVYLCGTFRDRWTAARFRIPPVSGK